jgi:cleavage and polyadenylation specificity factor subunit 2
MDQISKALDKAGLRYSIAFCHNTAHSTIDFAKKQLEWMSDDVMRMFDERRENPFSFK